MPQLPPPPTALQIWSAKDVPSGLRSHLPQAMDWGWAVYVAPGTPDEFIEGLVARCHLKGFAIHRFDTGSGGVLLVSEEACQVA